MRLNEGLLCKREISTIIAAVWEHGNARAPDGQQEQCVSTTVSLSHSNIAVYVSWDFMEDFMEDFMACTFTKYSSSSSVALR